ncbi:hypothetical protein, partial [Amycolatopsis speibonae]
RSHPGAPQGRVLEAERSPRRRDRRPGPLPRWRRMRHRARPTSSGRRISGIWCHRCRRPRA